MSTVEIDTPHGRIGAELRIPDGSGPWPGVVIIHDALGPRDPHREIAQRFADQGYLAMLPNLFSRGGAVRCIRSVFRDLNAKEGRAFDDIAAAREALENRADCTGAVGIAGFCMGGGFALLSSTRGFGASAPFYPAPINGDYSEIFEGACPIVASYGKRDVANRGTGPRLERTLTELGIDHDVKVYPGVGHSFADHVPAQPIARILGFGSNQEAAEDAWRRVFAFFDEHLRAS